MPDHRIARFAGQLDDADRKAIHVRRFVHEAFGAIGRVGVRIGELFEPRMEAVESESSDLALESQNLLTQLFSNTVSERDERRRQSAFHLLAFRPFGILRPIQCCIM